MELTFRMKDFRFGNVRVYFDAKQSYFELVFGFYFSRASLGLCTNSGFL